MCVSPAFGQRHFEQRHGQSQLLLPHSVRQDLSVRVVSVGLVAQLKQLPDGHTQRPETQDIIDVVIIKYKIAIRSSIGHTPCVI